MLAMMVGTVDAKLVWSCWQPGQVIYTEVKAPAQSCELRRVQAIKTALHIAFPALPIGPGVGARASYFRWGPATLARPPP